MNAGYFIGVDSGSQSTKVSIINQNGRVAAHAVHPLRPMMHRRGGWAEHPDDDLWESLKSALRQVLGKFEGEIGTVRGIGLCAIRCCRVFMRLDGSLAEPVMSWMDVRAYQPYRDDPEIGYTGSTSGYLTFRLTGEFRDTIANAYQYQFPTDMDTWRWLDDSSRFARFGIPRHKLFEARLPGEILGRVSAEAAAQTGLPEGLPVVSTANDKAVEALGSGLIEPDVALLSLGTYITSMVYGNENRPDTENFFTNLSSVPYRYLYESRGIRGGMWHVSWFTSIFGREFAEKAPGSAPGAEERLEAEAKIVPIGSEGLFIAPDWLASADQRWKKGVMLGFDRRHTRGHIYRALLEALAMRMKSHYEAMIRELNISPTKLIVCGGGSKSDLMMRIVADVFGVTAVRSRISGAAALGSAICAAVAVGCRPDYRTAVRGMVHEADTFPPDSKNHAAYTRIYQGAYRDLESMLEGVLKKTEPPLSPLDTSEISIVQ